MRGFAAYVDKRDDSEHCKHGNAANLQGVGKLRRVAGERRVCMEHGWKEDGKAEEKEQQKIDKTAEKAADKAVKSGELSV